MTCEHENFWADVAVGRLSKEEGGPITAFVAEVQVKCVDCGEPFVFLGPMQVGKLAGEPTASLDRTELRAPIRPVTAPLDFGLDTIGFTVNVIDNTPGVN